MLYINILCVYIYIYIIYIYIMNNKAALMNNQDRVLLTKNYAYILQSEILTTFFFMDDLNI